MIMIIDRVRAEPAGESESEPGPTAGGPGTQAPAPAGPGSHDGCGHGRDPSGLPVTASDSTDSELARLTGSHHVGSTGRPAAPRHSASVSG